MTEFKKKIIRWLFATPQSTDDKLNIRGWFYFYLGCLVCAVVLCTKSFSYYEATGSEIAWSAALLSLYCIYFSLACTFVPLPTSWFVLLLASPVSGLALDPLGRVLLVGALGAGATAVAHVHEYYLISYLLRLGKMRTIRQTRIYLWAQRIFLLAPFLLQVVFNIIPIPADPARWLAIMYRYPLKKYFLAHWLGRFIRYTLMAAAAAMLALTIRQIIIIQAVLLTLAVVKVGWGIRQKKPPEAPAVT